MIMFTERGCCSSQGITQCIVPYSIQYLMALNGEALNTYMAQYML